MATPDVGTSAPSSARWLSADEERAWVAVCHFMLQLPGALDSQLQRDADINLFEYLTLSRLSMAPHRTLRMSELAVLTGGSLSRLSNVIKRLETRGYVRRETDSQDRRYTNAILTDPGWEKVVAAAPGHVDAVRHFVLDSLNPIQLGTLADIGEQVRNQVQVHTAEAAADQVQGDDSDRRAE